MLAAVCADQRRASVLHRRFPLAETRDRAEHAMELLGLAAKRDRTAATLSHGDQKLLDIALALVLEPKVLLLDEPTAGMGTEERWRMIDKVHELWEKQKITVVFIEHDMDIVFKIAPEIVVLCYGRILATGTPDAIRRNEAVIEAYLGTEHHAEAAHERAGDRPGRGSRRLLRHQPDPVRRRPVGAAGRDHGAARPQRRRQVDHHEGDHGAGAGAARQGDAAAAVSCRG